jgi:hypothetical protein
MLSKADLDEVFRAYGFWREKSSKCKKMPKHTIFKKCLNIVPKTFSSATLILFALRNPNSKSSM